MAIKIDVTEVAQPFRDEIKRTIEQELGGRGPLVVGLLCTDDAGARRYANWTAKTLNEDGLRYELRQIAMADMEEELDKANSDDDVHGIMIYYPAFGQSPSFFGGTMDDYLRDSISLYKDVEGLCHTYRYNLYHNIRYLDKKEKTRQCVLPCTALSIVKILEHLKVYDHDLPMGDRMEGKKVTIINRSEIVGRPLAAMLANDGGEIYSVDIDSIFQLKRGKLFKSELTAEEACRMSDVIVMGVPSKDYKLPVEWIKEGAVVVNFSHFKNVDEEAIMNVPGVRYVPAIGKVTVAMLERNALRLHKNFQLQEDQEAKAREAIKLMERILFK